MRTHSALLRTAAAAALVTFGLAGCGMMKSMHSPSSGEAFVGAMTGAQESPPVNTAASGNAEVT